jgi:hypothetical protein
MPSIAVGSRQETFGLQLELPAITSDHLHDLASTLRMWGGEVLARRTALEMAELIGGVGRRFLDPADPLRQEALALMPLNSGLSPAMAEEVLDGMALDWTPERLDMLLHMEFAEPRVLDEFQHGRGARMVRARGPRLVVHIGAGNVPGVSVGSLIRSLLVKAPLLMKPGRTDVVLPVLFARGLAEADPEMDVAVGVAYWPSAQRELTDAALAVGDAVVAYGSDAVVGEFRGRTPPTTRITAYHHRMSCGLIGKEVLTRDDHQRVAHDAARAVSVFDQRGCVSPHVLYVEEGGEVDPRSFAETLADRLAHWSERLPPGLMEAEEASAVRQLTGEVEMRIAAGAPLELWSGEALAWGVILDPEPGFRGSCLGRVIRVRAVADLQVALSEMTSVSRHLQTVALEGVSPPGRTRMAEALAAIGASRVTSLADAPWPPPWWHHDGGGPLRSLIRWTDLER